MTSDIVYVRYLFPLHSCNVASFDVVSPTKSSRPARTSSPSCILPSEARSPSSKSPMGLDEDLWVGVRRS